MLQMMAEEGSDPELRQVAEMAHATLLRIEQVRRKGWHLSCMHPAHSTCTC